MDRRHHRAADRVLVQRALDLGVHALEALLREVEVGRVLVQALEHRAQRRLGVVVRGLAADPQVELGAGAQRLSRPLASGRHAQHVPALADERVSKGLVAVEDRTGPGLLHDVVLDLGAGLDVGRQLRRRLEREVAKRVVELAVPHGERFAVRACAPAPARA